MMKEERKKTNKQNIVLIVRISTNYDLAQEPKMIATVEELNSARVWSVEKISQLPAIVHIVLTQLQNQSDTQKLR